MINHQTPKTTVNSLDVLSKVISFCNMEQTTTESLSGDENFPSSPKTKRGTVYLYIQVTTDREQYWSPRNMKIFVGI